MARRSRRSRELEFEAMIAAHRLAIALLARHLPPRIAEAFAEALDGSIVVPLDDIPEAGALLEISREELEEIAAIIRVEPSALS